MYQVIIVVHVLLGIGVVSLVLLQQGKGADAGAAFGSASSGSVFGAQGASSFLSRTTAILAALFFSTSLGLAIIVGLENGEVDLMDAPEVEEVFADVPLINGADSAPVPAAVSDSIPVVNEELPAEVIQIQEEISNMSDTVVIEVEEPAIIVEDVQTDIVVEQDAVLEQ